MTDRELAGCALSDVLALLEKATPGEWSHAAEYGWNIATDNYAPMSRVGASVGMALWPKDAYAICASVNFLRQHGPALLAALSTPSSEGDGRDGEDARAWRQWCESVGAEQIVALNEKFGSALGLVRDADRYRWLRENAGEQIEMFQWLTIDTGHGVESVQGFLIGGQIDAAIDAAIAAAEGERAKE